ncbi:Na+/H+ antiporter NhaA [Campylobacter sp. RM13119]|uniref:Na+/H+ antiporter NhaA n=1 Tax=Campylobacter TaxID=194 RepID=UPI0014740CBA|nr:MULTISPECIES: Na+/H+ antiporter NhaA [unclassified Campylobacter]MBE3021726.1 Na+/H+ antiporter NhaA [Campylobacter sp. 7477a]MBE3606546.1 Na+/H+ antiporter NhaA [Campylobacter sp. RM13119]MBE3610250.1 Na+/H+ antiporter NhaA [Campylobacter sp. RM12916]
MSNIKEFLRHEASGGVLLMIATILALVCQNTFLSEFYNEFLKTKFTISFGDIGLSKALILWVNDGLMAVFFFLVGLELKREVLEGELRNPSQIALPAIAAAGGVIVPALIFYIFAADDSFALKGWAIPTATDIAFALGILSLLGSRVPTSLKIFLMTLAIIDDLCAIIIIALFYTSELSVLSLGISSLCLIALFALNRYGVKSKAAYLLVGAIMWVAVLKSGVHATLAGVVAAFFIPLSFKNSPKSMLKEIEHDLHAWVAFAILPIFAFVNAGIALKGVGLNEILSPVALGTALGLFIGKQLGVFGFSFVAIKFKMAKLPDGVNWAQLYGVAILCGVGFTMSLFVNGLAYNDTDAFAYTDKLAILIGSVISGVIGFVILRVFSSERKENLD